MPQIVALPNGEEAEFPDGMPDQEIEAILQKQFGAPKKDPAALFRNQLATAGSFGATPQPEDMPEGAAGKLALAGTIASLPLGVQAAGAPLAALRGLAMSAAGASAGGYAGTGLGRGLEMVGAPDGTSETAGTIGGLVGGVAGPVGGPMALAKLLKLGGGKAGMLGQIGERMAGAGAATVDATAKAAAAAEKEAARTAEREAARKLRERALAVAEERNALTRQRLEQRAAREAAKAAPKAGPRAVPEPAPAPRTEGTTALKSDAELIPDEAVSLVAEPLPFKPRASRSKFIDQSAVSAVPDAPIPQRGIPGDIEQIAMQIQQKSGMLRPDGAGMRGGKAVVQEELEKLPAGVRDQVETILARGQGHPATAASGGTRSVGTAVASESKPLSDPLMEFARKAAKGEVGGVNPVRGSKIWIELDPAGKPVGVLKDGYAHAKRGNTKTWVTNLWGSKTGSNVF